MVRWTAGLKASRCGRSCKWIVGVLTICVMPVALSAELHVATVFDDNAVLQRGQPINVWGWSTPEDRIVVSFAGHVAQTHSDSLGRWSVELPSHAASRQPRDLTVDSDHSGSVVRHNIVVGDVWVVSGQSNMAWIVEHSESVVVTLDKANNSDLRLFKVRQRCTPRPVNDAMSGFYPDLSASAWQPSTVSSARRFSAVGYHLGAVLERELGVPIGIIEAAVNGTRIEAWSPREVFSSGSEFQPEREWLDCALRALDHDEEELTVELTAWVENLRRKEGTSTIVNRPNVLPDEPLSWHRKPTCYYNGMLHGLTSFAISGMVWYQGESNLSDRTLYETRLDRFVTAMRDRWNRADLPIVLVQIAPFAPRPDTVWIWDAQLRVAAEQSTGLITIGDLADDLQDIHPRNKKDVGQRAANWILATRFGRTGLTPSGPLYKSATFNDGHVQIEFEYADSLATGSGYPSSAFEIAGDDRLFVPADASIVDSSVMVSSEQVAEPAAVRYAWRTDVRPDIYNEAGLPMMPFRTDDWAPVGDTMFAAPEYQCPVDSGRP